MFGLTYIKLAVIAGLVLAASIGGFTMGYRWEASEVANLKAQYATEKAAAIEAVRAQEQVWASEARDAVVRDANNQSKIIASTKAQLAQVQKNVKGIANSCVTLGALRLFNSAITGRPADSLPGDPGGDASRPAGIGPDTLANSFVENLGTCRRVIEGRKALNALLRQYQAERK